MQMYSVTVGVVNILGNTENFFIVYNYYFKNIFPRISSLSSLAHTMSVTTSSVFCNTQCLDPKVKQIGVLHCLDIKPWEHCMGTLCVYLPETANICVCLGGTERCHRIADQIPIAVRKRRFIFQVESSDGWAGGNLIFVLFISFSVHLYSQFWL